MAIAVDEYPRGTIKSSDEEFQVCEITDKGVTQPVFKTTITRPSGGHTLFVLTKRGVPGEAAYREIARQLRVSRRNVSDHGLKDKAATTAQLIVVSGDYQPTFEHEHIWLHQVGAASGPLQKGSRGLHEGNHFRILVRTDTLVPPMNSRFINLFGEQRFGDGQVQVGRMLLEGKFEQAANELMKSRIGGPKLRKVMSRHRLTGAQAVLHESFLYEAGFKVLQWQSHLWNQLAQTDAQQEEWLPMWCVDEAHRYISLWNPDRVHKHFLSMLHVFRRKVWKVARDHKSEKVPGGYWHSFSLCSGVYATVFLASLYRLEDVSRRHYG